MRFLGSAKAIPSGDGIIRHRTDSGLDLVASYGNTGSAVTYDGIFDDSYSHYEIEIHDLRPATDSASLTVRFRSGGSDVTGTYRYGGVGEHPYNGTDSSAGHGFSTNYSNTDFAYIGFTQKNTSLNSFKARGWVAPRTGGTKFLYLDSLQYSNYNGGSIVARRNYVSYSDNANDVDGISFAMSSGNLSIALIKIFGLSKAVV